MPVLAIHAPCLLLTQRVWSTDPWTKLLRAQAAAERVGAPTVVVHPPFRWQREYARELRRRAAPDAGRDRRDASRSRTCSRGGPATGRSRPTCRTGTCSSSTTRPPPSTSRTPRSPDSDAVRVVEALGDRLRTSTSPTARARTRTSTWCPAAAASRAPRCWSGSPAAASTGTVVLEVNTRRAVNRDEREADLAEGLAFARLNLAAAAGAGVTGAVTDRQLFDGVAADYDAYRPDYPAQLFDALESAMGQPLLWSHVLRRRRRHRHLVPRHRRPRRDGDRRRPGSRGARVLRVAVDVAGAARSSATATRCRCADGAVRPGVLRAVVPLDRPGSRDRPRRSGCCKPGGVLALWWNRHDLSVPWFARHQERLFAACGWAGHADESLGRARCSPARAGAAGWPPSRSPGAGGCRWSTSAATS